MTVQQHIQSDDRVVSALIAGLELEFGCRAERALAGYFLDAEASDFHWDARLQERWIGGYDSVEDEEIELDRVAVVWHPRGSRAGASACTIKAGFRPWRGSVGTASLLL